MESETESSFHSLVAEGEAASLLAHEMSNMLMVIQSRLDSMRHKFGDDKDFQKIHESCVHSATVLRGAITLLGKTSTPRELISLGQWLEQHLGNLARFSNHQLGLRTHDDCKVYTSAATLEVALSHVLKHFQADDPNDSLYIELYQAEVEKSHYAIISCMGPGRLEENKTAWELLAALMHLQGGDITLDTMDDKPRVCLVHPRLRKRDVVYAVREHAQVSSAVVIEDNQSVAEAVAMHLEALGIPQVTLFSNPQDALAWLSKHTPALVITDYSMRGMNGIDFLRQAGGALASSTVAIMSGMPQDDFKKDAESLDYPVKILAKPLAGDDLMRLVMESLSRSANEEKQAKQREDSRLLQSMEQTMRIPRPR